MQTMIRLFNVHVLSQVSTTVKTWAVLLTLLTGLTSVAVAQVVSVVPAKNALNVSPSTTVQVTFSAAMLTSSFNDTTSFIVSGVTSGRHRGTIVFSGGNTIATFTPTVAFKQGEVVIVDLTSNLKNASNVSITPVVYSFRTSVSSTPGTFAAKVDYATGSSPMSIYTCDVDGDGDADVLTANSGSTTVSVFKNNGNGTFAAKVDYTTGSSPRSVYACDADGDGDADIMVANNGSTTVSVLKNNGNGTFAAKVDYTTGSSPRIVYASDIDGDGDADMLIPNSTSNTISVLKNNGNGTFAAKVDYTTGSSPRSASAGDIDNDGDVDIFAANSSSNTVSVLKNNGNGTFAAKVDYTTGTSPRSVYASDIDGDGDADMMIANNGTTTVSVLKNNGDGTFAAKVDYTAGSNPMSIYAYDIDGDGDGDIMVANNGTTTVSVLKNNGDGTFVAKVDYTVGSSPYAVYASDIDSDGDVDMLAANSGSTTFSVLKGDPFPSSTITATSDANGSITPSGTVTVNNGANQVFTITPNTGYHIDSVIVDGVKVEATASYTFTNITSNHTIRLVFAINTYTLSASAVNGSVIKNPDQINYNYGTQVILTATPNFGYNFTHWSGDVTGLKNPDTLTMDANKSVTASFALNTYSLTINATNGSVTQNPAQANYEQGTQVILTAIPNTGYHFVDWSGDVTGATNPDTLTMDGNKIVTAAFAINTYTLTVNAVNGNVAKNPDQVSYEHGTQVELVATANSEYHFVEWSGDFTGTTNPDTLTMDANKSVTASFALNTYTLTINATNGSVTQNPAQANYEYGTQVILTAIPNTGYHFIDWSGDVTGTENPDTLTMDGNKAVTAAFAINTYTLTVNAVNGNVVKNPDQVSYEHGTQVELIATANNGYHFVEWSNDFAGTANPDTLTMDGNKTITANFAINIYTLTINAENGSVTQNPVQANYEHGMQVELTATPNTGYHFVDWKDDLSGAENPDTLTMDGNKIVTATFDINTYALTVDALENGSITPGTITIDYGSSQTFTITANPGYHTDSVFIDGVFVDSLVSYTFNNVTANHTMYATFAINTYTITTTAGTNGSITPSGVVEVNYGTNQTFAISPNSGYIIDSVVVDGASVGSVTSYEFTAVTANHSIAGYFSFNDTIKFRTFKESVADFTAKTIKLAYKKGKDKVLRIVAQPNMLTALENVFAKQVPKAGRTFLGVSQGTNKDSAKAYAWIDLKKGADLAKGFKTAHTGQSYPLDYFRDASKGTVKKLFKAIKFESKYNNPAIAQGILLKLNIFASAAGVTPEGFGSLVIDTASTLFGRNVQGLTLVQLADYFDSIMTYWKRFGVDAIEDYQELGNFTLLVLKPINERFYIALDTALATRNYTTDSAAIVAKKPYSVILKGAKTATDVGIVKYIPTTKAGVLSFEADNNTIPSGILLEQNYPNPFNPQTAIGFSLLAVGNVSLKIYDVLGREVTTLINNETMEEGMHEIQFDASRLSSGVYYYRLQAGTFTETKKMVLMK